MNLITLFLKGIPAIIFALFIGPWSDVFGRKVLMMVPLTGYILFNVWFMINAIFFDQMVTEWLMLEIFQWWPGGYQCMFMGAYSYVTDKSSSEWRTMRIGIVDFFFFGGMAIGPQISKHIKRKFDYTGIFAWCAIMQTLAFLYPAFFIENYTVSCKAQIFDGYSRSISSMATQNSVTIPNLREIPSFFQENYPFSVGSKVAMGILLVPLILR